MHSRRSYSAVYSSESAELWALLWAVERVHTLKLDNVIFDSSFRLARACSQRWNVQVSHLESSHISEVIISKLQQMNVWSLDYVLPARSSIALRIAQSVTSNQLYQSYIARAGPHWLHQAIAEESQALTLRPSWPSLFSLLLLFLYWIFSEACRYLSIFVLFCWRNQQNIYLLARLSSMKILSVKK